MESDKLELMKCRNIELEEQLKMCQNDLKKKDEHIAALSSMEIKKATGDCSDSIHTKAELVAIQMQLSNVVQKLEEYEINLKSKSEQVEELRASNKNLNEQLDQYASKEAELQTKLASVEKSSNELGCANSRSEVVIVSLQKELNESTEKIIELERRIKDLAITKGSADHAREIMAAKIDDFYKNLTSHLNVELDSEPNVVFDKVKLLTVENNMLKGEIDNLKSMAKEREEKYLESRETLRKLTQNIDKEKDDLEDYIKMKRDMTFEVEKIKVEKQTIESQNVDLNRQLMDTKKILEETKKILEEKEAQLSKIYLEKRESSFTMTNVSRELEGFKDSIAGILGNSLSRCPPNEEAIKERLKGIVQEAKEKDNTIMVLNMKLKNITEQYERHFDNSKENNLKARRVELEYLDLTDRIRQLEKELSSRDATRDSLRADKEKFYHFLRRLATILKMDPYTQEENFTFVFDGIIDRATNLVRSENEKNIDTNQTICSLKKRLRELKDQLHSRDLHLEMMRKKVANQDDKIREAYEDADQRRELVENEESLKIKLSKMQKKVDQLRNENKMLKAELFECSDIKNTMSNQNKEMETLQHNLQKLERVRQKQAEKIADFTKNSDKYEAEANQSRFVAENAVQSLTSEIKTLRSSLERARRSEKELLDFRVVVGRIIGLCVDDLAIPNYDIIRRLEKLVSVPKSAFTMAVPVQHWPVKNGYEDSSRLLGRKRRSPIRALIHDNVRPRSVSPVHGTRDSRKY